MKVVVINLLHRVDRKEDISKRLDKEGLEYSIWYGQYWRNPNFDTILKLNDMKIYKDWKMEGSTNSWWNRGVLMGEAAVAASYCLLFRELKNETEPVLILQDDATWKEGTLNKWIETIESKDMSDIDVIYLCGNPVNGEKTGDVIKDMDQFERPTYSYDAHAIVFYPSSIEKIMNSGLEKKLMSFDEYLMILYGQTGRKELVEAEYQLNIIKMIGASQYCYQINEQRCSDIVNSEVFNGTT